MTTTEKLLDRAQREVTRRELDGEDSQAIVNDILNDNAYAALFAGLSQDETFELCCEIQSGSDDLELELWERGELE